MQIYIILPGSIPFILASGWNPPCVFAHYAVPCQRCTYPTLQVLETTWDGQSRNFPLKESIKHLSDWWFGTFFMTFQSYWEESSSQLTLTPSFFRGIGWNHQPVVKNEGLTVKQWKKMEKSFILGLLVMLGSAKINQSWCVYYFFWIAQNGKIRIFAAPDMVVSLQKYTGILIIISYITNKTA